MQENKQEHFIKNIEIKNFKCFDDFKAEGFGRVNLIGGKNNVGKTALMEAVYVNSHSETIQTFLYALIKIYSIRNTLDILYIKAKNLQEESTQSAIEFFNHFYTQSNINQTFYKIEEKDGIKQYFFKLNNQDIEVNSNEFSSSLQYEGNIRFIDNLGLNKNDLKEIFVAVQIKDKENIVYDYINKFESTVLNFKIIGGDIPQCKTTNGDYRDLNQFGDGLKHFISIICSLYECNDGYLFIDEIDNGVHYSKLDLLWEIILTISKQQNVQVFATTHSKECIESYARVAKKLEETDIKFLSLYRNKESELSSITFDYEKIQDRIELGLDNR